MTLHHIDVDKDGIQSIGQAAASVVGKAAPIHESGIYFNLSDEQYHGDPALGSTGLKRLLQSAPDFWWQSPLNPLKEPESDETPAKIFGKAVHRCVLEGRAAFEKEYAPTDFSGATRDGKAERADIAAAGKRPLKRADFNRILAAAAFIAANPHVANAFKNGYPEVSVFWERDGVRLKARLDYLKLNAITDLKSIRNPYGKEFVKCCRDRIAEHDHAISAEHYVEGRRQMASLIAQERVFGAHDGDWLRKVAANDVFAFVLVFWQAEGAPISHGFKLSPGNPMFAYARNSIAQAIHNYQRYLKQFGADTAWVLAEPLQELDESEMPAWWVHKQSVGA